MCVDQFSFFVLCNVLFCTNMHCFQANNILIFIAPSFMYVPVLLCKLPGCLSSLEKIPYFCFFSQIKYLLSQLLSQLMWSAYAYFRKQRLFLQIFVKTKLSCGKGSNTIIPAQALIRQQIIIILCSCNKTYRCQLGFLRL